jgi:hypothetical protein
MGIAIGATFDTNRRPGKKLLKRRTHVASTVLSSAKEALTVLPGMHLKPQAQASTLYIRSLSAELNTAGFGNLKIPGTGSKNGFAGLNRAANRQKTLLLLFGHGFCCGLLLPLLRDLSGLHLFLIFFFMNRLRGFIAHIFISFQILT